MILNIWAKLFLTKFNPYSNSNLFLGFVLLNFYFVFSNALFIIS